MTVTVNQADALGADHFSEIIVDSAIDPDVAAARGYRTLHGTPEEREELSDLGFTRNVFDREETYPALLVPMYRATGETVSHQLKPAQPRMLASAEGKPRQVKYETPRGSSNHVDVPPFTQAHLGDMHTALWITEGMKKTDALVSQGIAAIGLTGVYNWRSKMGTLGDWEDIPLKGRPVVICFDADASDNRNVQLAMRRLGAWLESKGASTVHYLIVPAECDGAPVKGVDDWFAAGGTLGGLRDAARSQPPGDGPKDASFTDAVLAETACAECLEGSFCWAPGLGWMHWNGYVWKEVPDTRPTEAVRTWVIAQFTRVLAEQRADTSRELGSAMAGWRSVLSKGRIKALVDLARGVPGVAKDAEDFDADPDLLCVRNGYVDLRTGSLHAPDPDQLMTRCAGTEYTPGALHDAWNRVLEAVPEDVRPWYQDRIGQAATGHMTPDDSLVITHGGGSNGKSTVVSSVQNALGDYAVLLSDRVLMASPDAHPTELMDLRGARYAVLEETPEARRLDTHRLKKTVGTEKITARRIRQDDVSFDATHSLFVNTNFRPVVTETDHGTWRRLALLSFPYTYRKPGERLEHDDDRPGDPVLRDTARSDPDFRRAVLAWIVQGACAWYGRGKVMLPVPERVERDTLAWRAETDLVMGFAQEMLTFVREGRTGAREMLGSFNEWVEGQGHKPWTDKTFSSRFGAHEVVRRHRVVKARVRTGGPGSNPVMVWEGVTLGDQHPEKDQSPFGPQNGADPSSLSAHDRISVQGVQASPVNQKLSPIARVTGTDCTPCTAQVRGVEGQNGHPQISKVGGQNGHGSEPGGPTLRSDPAQPDPGPTLNTEGEFSWGIEPLPGPDPIGIDLETKGRGWVRHRGPQPFVTIAGWGNRVDASPEALVARMRAGDTWVGSNILGFDLLALERHHGLRVEEMWGRVRDVQLQAMLADPPTSSETKQGPAFKNYSLNAVSERVLGEPKDERGKKLAVEYCTVPRCSHSRRSDCNGWARIPASDERFRAYCTDDVDRALRIHRALPWTPYMEREMKVQTLMARMTLNGFRVDEVLLSERLAEGQARKADAVRELKERFGLPTERIVHLKTKTRVEPFKSPLATNEGKAWLEDVYKRFGVLNPPRTEKSKELATGRDALREVSEHSKCPPELKKILDLMGIVTSERTIYQTIADHLVDGRVHPDIWPRQASGRWSITDPGLTVMGKRGKLGVERGVMLPEEGEVIIAVDLAQIDARVVAAHAQDHAYLDMFLPGRDIHTETAVQLLGDKRFRDQAKAISHLANYGGGENKVISMGHDPRLVYQFFSERRKKFPRLIEWTDEVRSRGEAGELLDNGFGRPLRVDPRSAYTQAPAQVGQGGTRDMMAEGLLRLAERAPECLSMLRAIVHDEVVLSVPRESAEDIRRTVVESFECEWAPPGASRPVQVIAEGSRPGKNWYDAYVKE